VHGGALADGAECGARQQPSEAQLVLNHLLEQRPGQAGVADRDLPAVCRLEIHAHKARYDKPAAVRSRLVRTHKQVARRHGHRTVILQHTIQHNRRKASENTAGDRLSSNRIEDFINSEMIARRVS
jgi:hypothetical protein